MLHYFFHSDSSHYCKGGRLACILHTEIKIMTKDTFLSAHVVMHKGKGWQTGHLLSQYPSLWAFLHGPWPFLVLQLRILAFPVHQEEAQHICKRTHEARTALEPRTWVLSKGSLGFTPLLSLCGFGCFINFLLNFLSSSVRVRS